MHGPVRTELGSGAHVVSESRPGAQSVSFGFYFPTGSRHETRANNGISHFLEHLVFKGTPTRTADEVNREIDLLGGFSNAYTSKEVLCFHASVLPEHLDRALGLFGDLVAHGLPDGLEEEIDRERAVILAEISSLEDSPEELVGELADRALFGDHPLALPVVGDAAAVRRMNLGSIRDHSRVHLGSEALVVAAAGHVDHDALVGLVERHLDDVPRGSRPAIAGPPAPRPGCRVLERDLEQVQLCLSAPGVCRGEPLRAIADVLSCAVGEGYSSLLFREVRDRRGLAYSIGSSLASYSDSGSWNLWAAVAPESLAETLEVIKRVLRDVRERGVDAPELEAAREHLRGSLILAHESSATRMAHLAEQALIGSELVELEATLEALKRVESHHVRDQAAELLAEPLAVAAVGPVPAGVLPDDGLDLDA